MNVVEKLEAKIDIKSVLYFDRMGMLESSNNYLAVNTLNYWGRYQFHIRTLRLLKIKTTKYEFLNDPELQDEAMAKLTEHNYDYLKRNGLLKYVGKTVKGVEITKEGMLAGSHLLGPYAVKRFLHTWGKDDRKDAYGTRCSDYLREFENLS